MVKSRRWRQLLQEQQQQQLLREQQLLQEQQQQQLLREQLQQQRDATFSAALRALLLMLIASAFLTAAAYTGTTDGKLRTSADLLAATLSSLPTEILTMSKATVSAIDELSAGVKELSRHERISDDQLHRLELSSQQLVRLLRNDELLVQPAKMALDRVVEILEAFQAMIGTMYFVASGELHERLHEDISEMVYDLRRFSLENSVQLGGVLASIRSRFQQPVNHQQLLLDFAVSAACIVLVYRVSRRSHWRRGLSLGAAPLVTFLALQLLQWYVRGVSFKSVSPLATASTVLFAGCTAAVVSISNYNMKLLLPILIALTAIGAKLLIHACSVRAALGYPCLREMACPRDAVQLVTFDRVTNQLTLTLDAQYRLPRLKGPVYVVSEIGRFNTGKSVRLTVSYRMLLPEALRRKCRCGFYVRNADDDPALIANGKTRGVWMMSLPVSQIKLSDIESDSLKGSLHNLDRSGTVIFIDGEGHDEIGHDLVANNLIQLLVVQLSSHVNVAVKQLPSRQTIVHLGMLAHLCRLYSVFEKGRQSCQPHGGANDAPAVNLPTFALISMAGTELLPFFRDIKQNAGRVISLPSPLSLDAKILLDQELKIAQTQNIAAVDEIATYLKDFSYWGTLPATNEEKEFFTDMGTLAGLPTSSNPGFFFGWSVFNLPRQISLVRPKKINQVELSGAQLLEYIQQFIRITAHLDPKWLQAEAADEVAAAVCKHIDDTTRGYLVDASRLSDKLPIESSPICLNSEDKCPDADFEKEWSVIDKSITDTLCFLSKLMPDRMWKDCWRNHVEPQISKMHEELLSKNRELCAYRWSPGSWSEACSGTCPGYYERNLTCLNMRNQERPAKCCDLERKIVPQKSCENWSYDWHKGDWSPCSSDNCGNQTRSVLCKRCDGKVADDDKCPVSAEKPRTSQVCNEIFISFCMCEEASTVAGDQWCESNCGEKVPIKENCGQKDCRCSRSNSYFGAQNFVESSERQILNISTLTHGMKILAVGFANPHDPVVVSDEIELVQIYLDRKYSNFVRIQTVGKARITLGRERMLPVKIGDSKPEMTAAKGVKKGDSLLTRTDESGKLSWTQVAEITFNVVDSPVALLTWQSDALISNIVAATRYLDPFKPAEWLGIR